MPGFDARFSDGHASYCRRGHERSHIDGEVKRRPSKAYVSVTCVPRSRSMIAVWGKICSRCNLFKLIAANVFFRTGRDKDGTLLVFTSDRAEAGHSI